jgi:hypothetical protein
MIERGVPALPYIVRRKGYKSVQGESTSRVRLGVFCHTEFEGKTECIDHVCARIKLHTRLAIMNTKNSATRIKSYYKQ